MNLTRRRFLSSASALSLAQATPLAMSLAQIGRASAQSVGSGDDYKALVCIYLGGGNDYANTLVPFDAGNYAIYQNYRTSLAYQRDALQIGPVGNSSAILTSSGQVMTGIQPLTGTVLRGADGQILPALEFDGTQRQFALAPPMSALLPHFNSSAAADRRLAVLLNVGPLVAPVTPAMRQQFMAMNAAPNLPTPLFAHDYQTSYWLTSDGVDSALTGWGARAMDSLQYANDQATFSAISIAGNTTFLTGDDVFQYQVGTGGPDPFYPVRNGMFGAAIPANALEQIVTNTGEGIFERAHTAVVRRAIASGDILRSGIDPAANVQAKALVDLINGSYPGLSGPLGSQLAMVARIIAARGVTGAKRQVFYVSLGGFDTHSDMVRYHPGLLQQVARGMDAFYRLTKDMGCADKVTSFTAADFGRTFVSNGDGTDHGWGGMHFVLGGAVKGGKYYGLVPKFGHQTEDDLGSGRLIPTMAVDQVATTLALWMGVPQSDLGHVVPPERIAAFNTVPSGTKFVPGMNLGFL